MQSLADSTGRCKTSTFVILDGKLVPVLPGQNSDDKLRELKATTGEVDNSYMFHRGDSVVFLATGEMSTVEEVWPDVSKVVLKSLMGIPRFIADCLEVEVKKVVGR